MGNLGWRLNRYPPDPLFWDFYALFWLAVGISAASGIATVVAAATGQWWWWIPLSVAAGTGLAALAGAVAWPASPAWRSGWFRERAWWAARILGSLRRGLALTSRSWLALLVSLTIVAGVVALALWVSTAVVGSFSAQRASLAATAAPTESPTAPAESVATPADSTAAPAETPTAPADSTAAASSSALAATPTPAPLPRLENLQSAFLYAGLAFTVLLGLTLLSSGWASARARRRLVLVPFVNHTGVDKLSGCVSGLPQRLLAELSGLVAIYQGISTEMPLDPAAVVTQAMVAADAQMPEPTEDGTITISAPAEVAKVQIPLWRIFGMASRSGQAKQLTGSLHREGDALVLVAAIEGGGYSNHWRVSSAELPECPTETARPSCLIERLTYLVLAEYMSVGSPSWQAVYEYTQGLRIYRETRQTRIKREAKLRLAESHFVHALAMDTHFAQCHYNLAVVYNALGLPESAEESFRRALEEYLKPSDEHNALGVDPSVARAAYALAENWWRRGMYGDQVIMYCDKAIRMQPEHAPSYDLRAMARRGPEARYVGGACRVRRPQREAAGVRDACIRWDHQVATALAWKALCGAAVGGGPHAVAAIANAKDIARRCTRNLARALADQGRYRESVAVWGQAVRLAPTDAELRLGLGQALYCARQPAGAREARDERRDVTDVLEAGFEHVLDCDKRAAYTACLSAARAGEAARREDARGPYSMAAEWAPQRYGDAVAHALSRCRNGARALEYGREQEHDDGERCVASVIGEAAAYTDAPVPDRACIGRLNGILNAAPAEIGADDETRLRDARASCPGSDWAEAQVRVRLAEECLRERPAEARAHVERAIEVLEPGHSQEVRDLCLHETLAEAYRMEGRLDQALFHAMRSVLLEPDEPAGRIVLGRVHLSCRDYERAALEMEFCLEMSPRPRDLMDMASTLYSVAEALRDLERRRKLLEGFVAALNDALQVVESQLPREDLPRDDEVRRGVCLCAEVHYWLGQCYSSLTEHEQAADHLRIAQAVGFEPVKAGLALGSALTKLGAYAEATKAFRAAIAGAKGRHREPGHIAREWCPRWQPVSADELALEVELGRAWAGAADGALGRKTQACLSRAAQRLERLRRVDALKCRHYEAQICLCRGYTYYVGRRYARAAKELECASRLAAGGETLYHLARSYLAQAQQDTENRERLQRQADEARRQAVQAGLSQRYVADLENLFAKAPPEAEKKAPEAPPEAGEKTPKAPGGCHPEQALR